MPTGNQSGTPQLKSADQTSRSLRSGRCTWTAAGYTETQHNTPPRARQKLAGFYSCRISPDPAASASTCEFGRRGRQPRPGRPVCHAMCRRAGRKHGRATRADSTVRPSGKQEPAAGKASSDLPPVVGESDGVPESSLIELPPGKEASSQLAFF